MSRGRIIGKVVLFLALPVGLVMFLLNGILIPRMDIDAGTRTTLTAVITYGGIVISSMGCALWAQRMANRPEEEAPGESEDS